MPATTVARSPTASIAARKRSSRSSSVRVGLSPVVPATTIPSEPLSTRCARERLERVEVDRPVVAKRRDDRRQDVAEHAEILRPIDTRTDGAIRARPRCMARWLVLRGARPRAGARGHEVVALDLPVTTSGSRQHDYARLVGPQPDAIVLGHSLGAQTVALVPARTRVYLGASCRVEDGRQERSPLGSAAALRDELDRFSGRTPKRARRGCTRTARARSRWAFAQLRRQAQFD